MKTTGMARSTPAEQRMNCGLLCKMLDYFKVSPQKIHSLLILRNGYLVTDAYFYPFHSEIVNYINCCTASIISALVGIALGEGLIGDIKDRLSEYFPEYALLLDNPMKKDITVEHLLMMAAGLEWDDVNNVFGKDNYYDRMFNSEDPAGFILEQPMREEPGRRYNHCAGAPHLLSALLRKVTGMTTSAYAEEKLFKPLGITGTGWLSDKKGVDGGGSGLSMTAKGLAKIGLLYLQKGKWEGRQIINENWVNLSTRKHIETPEGPWSFYGGGYQWNMNRFGGYSAKGTGGQYLAVVPNLNLVVVMMAALSLDELFWPETIMETFIIPAARLADASQTNLQNQKNLDKSIHDIAQPPFPKPVGTIPVLAGKISGRKYIFRSPASINGILLDFRNKDFCIWKVWNKQSVTEIPVGLDDVYRAFENEVYKGFWQNANIFIIKMWNLCFNYEMEYEFIFLDDRLDYKVTAPGWGVCEELTGEIQSWY